MTDYYGYQHHYTTPYAPGHYVYRDNMEYRGYDKDWVIGRERRPSYGSHGGAYHYGSGYDHDAYHHGHSRSRSRAHHHAYDERYGRSEHARLAWPTEIPLKLRVSLCCDDCRWRLDEALRYIQGVYDVGISGRSNAFVTVTGTGDKHKILETARQLSSSAEIWSENSHHKSWF